MNYAEDRLDRKTRYVDGTNRLEQDYDQALFGRKVQQQRTTTTPTTGTSTTEPVVVTVTERYWIDHELLGRTLRDMGLNYNALYHYGQHWCCCYHEHVEQEKRKCNHQLDTSPTTTTKDTTTTSSTAAVTNPTSDSTTITTTTTTISTDIDHTTMTLLDRAVGDYAQMAELTGYPEIGCLTLFLYRYYESILLRKRRLRVPKEEEEIQEQHQQQKPIYPNSKNCSHDDPPQPQCKSDGKQQDDDHNNNHPLPRETTTTISRNDSSSSNIHPKNVGVSLENQDKDYDHHEYDTYLKDPLPYHDVSIGLDQKDEDDHDDNRKRNNTFLSSFFSSFKKEVESSSSSASAASSCVTSADQDQDQRKHVPTQLQQQQHLLPPMVDCGCGQLGCQLASCGIVYVPILSSVSSSSSSSTISSSSSSTTTAGAGGSHNTTTNTNTTNPIEPILDAIQEYYTKWNEKIIQHHYSTISCETNNSSKNNNNDSRIRKHGRKKKNDRNEKRDDFNIISSSVVDNGNTILRKFAKYEVLATTTTTTAKSAASISNRKDKNDSMKNNKKMDSTNRVNENIWIPCIINNDHIPILLQFWMMDHPQCQQPGHSLEYDHTNNNYHDDNTNCVLETTTTRSKPYPFPPVLQLLLLKLLYLVIPSLAIEANPNMVLQSIKRDKINKCNTNHQKVNTSNTASGVVASTTSNTPDDHHPSSSYLNERYMARNYKSHWAYYVFIRYLVLGERIKEHRYQQQQPYSHTALWDTLWWSIRNNPHNDVKQQQQQPYHNNNPMPQEEESPKFDLDQCQKQHVLNDESTTLVTTYINQLREMMFPKTLRNLNQNQQKNIPPPLLSSTLFMSSRLSTGDMLPVPLYVIGDSHVLSLAWQTIHLPTIFSNTTFTHENSNSFEETKMNGTIRTPTVGDLFDKRILVPVIATGLKAWHVQGNSNFFTGTCLRTLFQRVARSMETLTTQTTTTKTANRTHRTVIISAGEIDCREGMGGELLAGYDIESHRIRKEHVTRTVRTFVHGLLDLLCQQNEPPIIQQILVMPVAPHAKSSKRGGRVVGQEFRRETMIQWNQELRKILPYQNRIYYLDYTNHLIEQPSLDRFPKQNNTRTTRTTGSSPMNDHHRDGGKKEDTEPFILNPIYNADSTHMNNAFLPHFVNAIQKCGCDFSLL